jgi:Protein of unknown function (DUF3054)
MVASHRGTPLEAEQLMASIDSPQPSAVTPGARRGALLIAGDVLAFLIFAAIGRASHNEAAGFTALAQVAETAAPFAIGWFVAAPLIGAFRAEVVVRPRRMLARTALAWLLAWPLGLLLRALIRQTGIPFSFAIVTLITNLLILLGWRGVFTWLASRRDAS